ncbi:hypothetical protein KDA00_01910 [Candidatus Saccharibacteria bacterium]|nr:hypothetical protein [Candidatus Saccharibacteria bacterium]
MSDRKGIFDRAFDWMSSSFERLEQIGQSRSSNTEIVFRNGVSSTQLLRLFKVAKNVVESSVLFAEQEGVCVSIDPYKSVDVVFVDRVGFRDVLSGCCSIIEPNFRGFIARNRSLAGTAIRLGTSADIASSIFIGSYDINAESPVAFTDRISIDDSAPPNLFHENDSGTCLIPNQEIMAVTSELLGAVASTPAINLCMVDGYEIKPY